MSLEAILSKIEGDVEKEAGAIREKAEQEKREAIEKQAMELEERRKKGIERINSGILEEQKRKEYHVRREAAGKLMNARRTLMDNAIGKAIENLSSESDEKYLEMVSSLLDSCDLEGEVEVVIAKSDELRITEKYLEKHSCAERKYVLSNDRHEEKGGILLRVGSISQNGTFPMIAELIHEDLIMKLSDLIPLEKN